MATLSPLSGVAPAEHYERWPFPGVAHRSPEGLILLRRLQQWLAPRADGRARRVVDVGCGTGHTLLALARHFPAVEFLGLDASGTSLQQAEAAAQEMPGSRVRFLQQDLQEPLPELGHFDVVLCLGVLHHVPALEAAFDRVARLVRSDGRLVVWLYGRHGRASHVLNQRFLRLIAAPGCDDEDRAALARSFLEGAGSRFVQGSGIYTPHGDGPEGVRWLLQQPQWIADQLFPACEWQLTLDDIFGLLESSGLAFEHWFGVSGNAAHWLPPGLVRDRLDQLPRQERLRALECVLRPAYYYISAMRRNAVG